MLTRLSLIPTTQIPPELQPKYSRVTGGESGLPATYQALFANLQIASKLADLDEIVSQGDLEPRIRLTVALTVSQERNSRVLWESLEPLARQAGVTRLHLPVDLIRSDPGLELPAKQALIAGPGFFYRGIIEQIFNHQKTVLVKLIDLFLGHTKHDYSVGEWSR